MDERMRFQANKENLETLINRFRVDFGDDNIELLKYFVSYARENVVNKESLGRLHDYLTNVYYYTGEFNPVDKAIKLLEYKTNNENGYIEHYNKVKSINSNKWKEINLLNNELNESILMNDPMSIEEVSIKLNEILDGGV